MYKGKRIETGNGTEALFGSEVEVIQFLLDCNQKTVPEVQQSYYLK
jgi:hypothetical protein